MKTKLTKTIQSRIQWMFDRKKVHVPGDTRDGLIIQRVSLDGEFDIYSEFEDDVIYHDLAAKDIKLVKNES